MHVEGPEEVLVSVNISNFGVSLDRGLLRVTEVDKRGVFIIKVEGEHLSLNDAFDLQSRNVALDWFD